MEKDEYTDKLKNLKFNVEKFGKEAQAEDEGKEPAPARTKPPSKSEQIRSKLIDGVTRDQLVQEGYSKSTVRTIASEMKKEFGREFGVSRGLQASDSQVRVFAKGSPPEELVKGMKVPFEDGTLEEFEQGMRFGASMLVLGVRMAQELSAVGVSQARPLLQMAQDMRAGEAAAAKNAAGEAATQAASMVYQQMQPVLSNLSKPVESPGSDPVKNMMVRMVEPLMGNMIKKLMPGMMGDTTPQGWTKRSV